MKKQSGQSLVEVTVALLVAGIMIVAIISLAVTGLRNAQFAQNQSRATKYAQEAIDQIISIRDRNGAISFSSTLPTSSSSNCSGITTIATFHDLYCFQLSSNQICNMANQCFFGLKCTSSQLCQTFSVNTSEPKEQLPDGLFRTIMISDGTDYSNSKTIKVKVIWTDSSGEHISNLERVVSKRVDLN